MHSNAGDGGHCGCECRKSLMMNDDLILYFGMAILQYNVTLDYIYVMISGRVNYIACTTTNDLIPKPLYP